MAPGYAKHSAYVQEAEVCRRITVTNRKITEADLKEDDPLYCDRATREGQTSVSPPPDGGDEEGIGDAVVDCFREYFQRLKILIMESITAV